MPTFHHSGDLGDVVYALPVIRALGGGDLFITEHTQFVRPRSRAVDVWANLHRLLECQPYLNSVQFSPDPVAVDYDLNSFRATFNNAAARRDDPKRRLVDHVLDAFGVSRAEADGPWLSGVDGRENGYVIFNRTERYHNPSFPWGRIVRKWWHRSIFLGTAQEHDIFCQSFGKVPHLPTDDLYTAARLLVGCKAVVCNQSCLYAICEGLKLSPVLLEVCPSSPDCLFYRDGVVHGWDYRIELPVLE